MAKTPRAEQDHQTGEGADTTEALKERVSPAVQVWLDLITDVIVEEVIKEHRAKCENTQTQFDGCGKAQAPPEKGQQPGGPPRDDQGQTVVKPKGRLLTVQEAADYLGMSRAALAGRGWRIKNRLPAIKIGRAVRFDLQMLDRGIERHREHLPRLFSEEDEERRSPGEPLLHLYGRSADRGSQSPLSVCRQHLSPGIDCHAVPEPQRKRSSADSLMSTDWSGWRRDERRFLRSTGRSEGDVTPLDFSLG